MQQILRLLIAAALSTSVLLIGTLAFLLLPLESMAPLTSIIRLFVYAFGLPVFLSDYFNLGITGSFVGWWLSEFAYFYLFLTVISILWHYNVKWPTA